LLDKILLSETKAAKWVGNSTSRTTADMAKKKKCYWSADGSYLPIVDPHTQAKHRVLEDYVQKWIETLTGHGVHGPKKVTLIDGFSGGGMYQDGWEGSSIRMIRKLLEGFSNIQKRKPWYELSYEFIFIDEEPDHTSCLTLQLKQAGFEEFLHKGICKVITGHFDDNLDYCIERVKSRGGYSFFFLDPFGLDITPSVVRKILNVGRSEVLFNHMLSGLVRLIKNRDTKYANLFNQLEADDYYREIANQPDFLARQAYLRDQSLQIFRQEGKADFLHTFALMSNPKTVLYYLIHLSSNPTALSVMRDAAWGQSNLDYQFHYDVYGLGYRTLNDYQDNLNIFSINNGDVNFCLNNLTEQLAEFIFDEGDSEFGKLYCSTIQKNPATRHLYMRAINVLQEESDVEIIREGKSTESRVIQSRDVIRRSKNKQLILLGRNDIMHSVQQKKRRQPKRSNPLIYTPDIEQLSFLQT
jgi:three-Cys-motif partner protein